MEDTKPEPKYANLQFKLRGKFLEAFNMVKERPILKGRACTGREVFEEIMRTLPEWKAVNK